MLDLLSMFPGSAAESLIQDNADDITTFLVDLAKKAQPWNPGEVPAFTLFVKPAEEGKPETVAVLVQALDATTLAPLRNVHWFDLRETLRRVPLAAWLKKGQQAKKLGDKLSAAEADRKKHFDRHGNDAKHEQLAAKVHELRKEIDALAATLTMGAPAATPAVQ